MKPVKPLTPYRALVVVVAVVLLLGVVVFRPRSASLWPSSAEGFFATGAVHLDAPAR